MEDRHGYDNLIIMCGVHHKYIDAPENIGTFTVGYLHELKRVHELGSNHTESLPHLTDDQVESLIQGGSSYNENSVHMDFRQAVFRAGGEGGGMGGGGGSGGVINIVGTTRTPPEAVLMLQGGNATAPGGGGGGSGILIHSGRPVGQQDVDNGLRASSLFTANAVSISDGLFNVLGGGWAKCPIQTTPTDVAVWLVSILETGTIEQGSLLRLQMRAIDMEGITLAFQDVDVPVADQPLDTPRSVATARLAFKLETVGTVRFQIVAGEIVLATFPLQFQSVAT